jgi:hypothetical protein
MKLDRASIYASDLLGEDISSEAIRRMETGFTPPDKMKPLVLVALCRVYDKQVSDLPEVLQARVEHARDLLIHDSRCNDVYPGAMALFDLAAA